MLLIITLTLAATVAAGNAQKANADDTFQCYTCLGRDYDNCLFGKTSCAGACWKLVDQQHEIVAKGCTAEDKLDGSQEADVDMKVKLPWSQDEKESLRGTTYYCKSDLCNGNTKNAPTLLAAAIVSVLAIVLSAALFC